MTSEKILRNRARKGLWLAIVTIVAWLAIGGFSGQAFFQANAAVSLLVLGGVIWEIFGR